MTKKLISFAILSLVLIACSAAGSRYFGPLNEWDVSCGADRGSIRKSADVWTFKTSDNYCSGGTFKQRAEIKTDDYSTRRAGDFLFSSNVTMMSASPNEYSIFSIHDGRNGCAPPLQLFVRPDGRMYISSDVKTGPGESCIRGFIGGTSSDRVLRNGTEQLLQVLVQFDGEGSFDVTVWLDGTQQIQGTYNPQSYVQLAS